MTAMTGHTLASETHIVVLRVTGQPDMPLPDTGRTITPHTVTITYERTPNGTVDTDAKIGGPLRPGRGRYGDAWADTDYLEADAWPAWLASHADEYRPDGW